MKSTRSNAVRWSARALLFAFTAVVSTAVVISDADAARRLGGGKSFGRQAAPVQREAPNAAPQPAPPAQREAARAQQQGQQAVPGQAAQPPAAAPARNRWLGPLAGIAAGLGIAALLSHLGLSDALAQLLGSVLVAGLLGLAILLVWRVLRGASSQRPLERRMEPAYDGAGGLPPQPGPAAAYLPQAGAPPRPGSVAATLGSAGSTEVVQSAPRPGQVPADFDVQGFLRSAKVHFHRLQESWERRDLEDLSEFTTPEVFAELRTQLAEQPELAGRNEVTALEADLLGIDEGLSDWLASVRFRGAIREAGAPEAQTFEEIWNLSKRKDGRSGWLLAGVQ